MSIRALLDVLGITSTPPQRRKSALAAPSKLRSISSKHHRYSSSIRHTEKRFLLAGPGRYFRLGHLVLSLSACGASKKAEPAQVEIEWPDAAVQHSGPALESDAGVLDAALPSPDA